MKHNPRRSQLDQLTSYQLPRSTKWHFVSMRFWPYSSTLLTSITKASTTHSACGTVHRQCINRIIVFKSIKQLKNSDKSHFISTNSPTVPLLHHKIYQLIKVKFELCVSVFLCFFHFFFFTPFSCCKLFPHVKHLRLVIRWDFGCNRR